MYNVQIYIRMYENIPDLAYRKLLSNKDFIRSKITKAEMF